LNYIEKYKVEKYWWGTIHSLPYQSHSCQNLRLRVIKYQD